MLFYIESKDKVFTLRRIMAKDTLLNLRVKQETVAKLNKVSDYLDVPYSQIVRDAINEKLEKLQLEKPELKSLLAEVALPA
jgi:hypothetical protein